MSSASVLKLDSELLKPEKVKHVQYLTNSYPINTASTTQSKPKSRGSFCSCDLHLGFRMLRIPNLPANKPSLLKSLYVSENITGKVKCISILQPDCARPGTNSAFTAVTTPKPSAL